MYIEWKVVIYPPGLITGSNVFCTDKSYQPACDINNGDVNNIIEHYACPGLNHHLFLTFFGDFELPNS